VRRERRGQREGRETRRRLRPQTTMVTKMMVVSCTLVTFTEMKMQVIYRESERVR
jgi:hypothetical protein